jgi:hypothetical protein
MQYKSGLQCRNSQWYINVYCLLSSKKAVNNASDRWTDILMKKQQQ